MLDDLGHRRVRVLDGGIQAWAAIGGPITQSVPAPRRGHLTLRSTWSRVIDLEHLAPRLRTGDVAVIDARAPERYRGDIEPIDPVAGHIPTAVNLPTGGNLASDGRNPLARRPLPVAGRARGTVRAPRAGRRDDVRVGDHRLPQRARDAGGAPARSPALPGLVQRLVALGDADRDR